MSDGKLRVAGYEAYVDNDQGRVYLRFEGDISKIRRPTAIVIDAPGEPVTLEDEEGILVEFDTVATQEDYVLFAFGGVVHVVATDPATGERSEPIPVETTSRVHLISSGE